MEHMKKILLRITALVLAAVLTAGLLPSASAERFTGEVDTREYNMEGQSILGSMIVNDLNEAQQSDTGDSLYDVTDLVIDGSTATVEFYAEEDAELVVALYTEDGAQLLTSAKTDVTADMTQATLTFDGEMPQYFTAAAYLLDSYDFSPLCAPYESIRYTREIQELLASDIHDYDPELVLNLDESEGTNFVVYDETTIRITEQEGVNLVTFADYDNLIYVIENADEQFTSLTEGDVFAYVYGEDQQLLMAKVAGIDIDGTTVTIQGGELELEDVFSHVKLQAVSDPDTMTVDESTGAEGVVYLGRGGTAGDCAPQAVGSFFKSFEFELPHIQTGDYDFSGKLGLDLEVEMEVLIEGTSRFVRFNMSYTSTLTFEMDLTGDDAKLEIPINKILVPIIPRLVDVGISPNLVLQFNASISGTISSSASVGIQISQKGWGLPKIKERCKKPSGELSFQVEGSVFFGLELEPEIVLACGAGELNLGFEGGFVAEGTLVKISDEDTGLHHDCVGCVTGECSIKIGMTAEGRLGWVDVETTLAGKKFPLPKLDFYLCLYHGERGFGECPHMQRRVILKVRDENGDPIEGASVFCAEANFLISDEYTNSKGVAEIYLPKGTYEVTVRKDGLTKVKTVKVKDPKKVTVKLAPEKPEADDSGSGTIGGSNGSDYIDYGKRVQSGTCGDDLTWDLYEDGTLLIDGKGPMYDYEYDYTDAIVTSSGTRIAIYTTAPWSYYGDQIKEIEIAEGVTSIGERAFALLKLPVSVEIPDSVTRIGLSAFYGCVGLRSVYIGTGLEYIDESAFDLAMDDRNWGRGRSVYVESLEHWLSITRKDSGSSPLAPNSGSLFHGNDMSADLYIPKGTTEIKDYAFYNCKNLTGDLEIPESVERIGVSVFSLSNISCVSFSNGDLYVDECAFASSNNLVEVHVPSLAEWLKIQFNGLYANPLGDHQVGLTGYKDVKLYVGGNHCTDLVIPDGIDVTGTYSFAGYDLNSVTFPDSMTEIPEGMFTVSSLEEIELPETIEHIGNRAFADCYSLKSAIIHSGTICEEAFDGCENLTDVTILGGVDSIGPAAFKCCSSLKNLTIADGVETIDDFAFEGCYSLESVKIPGSVKWMGSYVFWSSLKEVWFLGDAPDVYNQYYGPFTGVSATAYYPEGNDTWNWRIQADIGRDLTWVPYDPEEGIARNSGISVCAAPEKPTVGTDAIYGGEYDTGEKDGVEVKTADFEGLVPGAEYTLLAMASLEAEDLLAPDNLLYIGHGSSGEDGTASFTYIPREFRDRSIVVLCGPSNKDLNDAVITLPLMGADGETWDVEPTVVYDGVTLIEGKDYELTGAVSYRKEGTYTFQIHGIHDYTGVVELTYSVADHIHEFPEYTADGNATCLEDGTKSCKCSHCDFVLTLPDPGSALGHDWDEGVVTVEPTEETEGESFHTCLRCGETKTEVLPRKEHVHEYELVWEIPGNCQLGGSKIYQCRTCGHSYETERGEPEPHTWDKGVVTKEPTEETEGEMLYTCTYCSETKTEPIPRIHDCTLEPIETIAPTCTEPGYTRYRCTYCAGEVRGDEVAALGHDWGEVLSVVEPTCTDYGYTVYGCTRCDETDQSDYVGSLGHDWDNGVVIKEPTYEEDGEERYTCMVCGYTATFTLPRLHDHSYYVEEVVEPTCTSGGYTVYRCEVCGEARYDDFVPVTDHPWDEGVVTVEPTEEHAGEKLYTCTYCGETRTEVLPKLHYHSYMVLRVVEPDCINQGYTIYLCSSCGDVCFDDYVDALGHSFGGWTAVGNGLEERVCQRCGYVDQRTAGQPENPFTDVPEGSFYHEPVLWAVENGITNGTSATTFGPNDQCMRAHVVTFLWRAAGSPEPAKTDNPFVDVKKTDFYYKAVLWAVENGVTNGLDATHFGPFTYCNRAQVVTFLYRSLGSPAVEAQNNPFTDVPAGQWFTTSVLWAVENGVTNGLSATSFGPTAVCNRAQIVTFLYRAFAK